MVRAPQSRADQSHGGGDGATGKVRPASGHGNLPAAAASKGGRRLAEARRNRLSAVWFECLPGGAADHHQLRAAAAAHSAKTGSRGIIRRNHPRARELTVRRLAPQSSVGGCAGMAVWKRAGTVSPQARGAINSFTKFVY